MRIRTWQVAGGGIALLLLMVGPLGAAEVVVELQNLSQPDGFWLSAMWVGFHDGSFDLFDKDVALPPGSPLKALVEDGDPKPLMTQFARDVPGGVDGVIGTSGTVGQPAIGPGGFARMEFTVDPEQNQYMSYASMIMPSNDAFIGNDNPEQILVFDSLGKFAGVQVISIYGCGIWDAGTELNQERDAAFFGQTAPGIGLDTSDRVEPHRGLDTQRPIILGGVNSLGIYFDPVAANFGEYGNYRLIARITVIPEPATVLLLLGGLLLVKRRR